MFRYNERTIHQAIVQKLARSVTGLRAVELLWKEGLFQEQGTMQRVVDEINEDVQFISLAVVYAEWTKNHENYLQHFYAEEFKDPDNIAGSHASRGMVSRDKIRAYINGKLGDKASQANVAGKILTKAYSGFVHAASPHIMDMCVGMPGKPIVFDISGSSREFRGDEFANDALNYFYRALLTMAFAGKAFGEEELTAEMKAAADQFARHMRGAE